ncbi:MAG TPA: RbsD/FucU domain-containing protein, partial [Acidobacteriaceae bacterium]|nr:RbsD/FucU domain-containing protein [Acidobacteriaceae bacterium]
RHTNTLIVTDMGFPHVAGVETVDISLVSGMPSVPDVVRAIRLNFKCGKAVMASEFREVSSPETVHSYEQHLSGIALTWEPHIALKARAKGVVGIIRTGDTTRFGNIVLESA